MTHVAWESGICWTWTIPLNRRAGWTDSFFLALMRSQLCSSRVDSSGSHQKLTSLYQENRKINVRPPHFEESRLSEAELEGGTLRTREYQSYSISHCFEPNLKSLAH